jgi:hypothetical protein
MDTLDFLPPKIILGGSIYKVIQRSALWRRAFMVDGQCRFEDMEVDLVVENRPVTEICNTLLHECLHLCYREFQIKPKCGEERTVTGLGYALNSLFAQNPDLLSAIELLQETARESADDEEGYEISDGGFGESEGAAEGVEE